MAGFYVYNNVGIAFRCFATGVLFGLGSVFFLVYNGLQMGAVAGLLTASGRGFNLLTFVASHGAFELTAIVIPGTAGLVMGYALVDTRRPAPVRFAAGPRPGHRPAGAGRGADAAAGGADRGVLVAVGVPAAVKLSVAAGLYAAWWRPTWRWRARRGEPAMNLFAARVVLRPRSLTEVLDLAVPFCLQNARLLGRLSLVVAGAGGGGRRRAAAGAGLVVAGGVGRWLVSLAWLAEGVFTVALGEALFRDPARCAIGAALGRFGRRLPALLIVQVTRAAGAGWLRGRWCCRCSCEGPALAVPGRGRAAGERPGRAGHPPQPIAGRRRHGLLPRAGRLRCWRCPWAR